MHKGREAAGRTLPINTPYTPFQKSVSFEEIIREIILALSIMTEVFIYLIHFFRIIFAILRLTWKLDTQELRRNLGRKKNHNSWLIFIQFLWALQHLPFFKHQHFVSRSSFFKTSLFNLPHFTGLCHFFITSSLKGINCTSPAPDITKTGNNP